MHKKKGRKIFTYRVKNRRVFSPNHPMRRAVGTVLLLAVMVFLGIVGYNVVGPLVERFAAEKESPTLTDEPYFTTAPPVTESAAVTTVLTTAAAAVTSAAETTEVTYTAIRRMQFPADMDVVCELTREECNSLNVLTAAAAKYSARGYTALLIPLKLSSYLYYQSENADAINAGLIGKNALPLREVTEAAGALGMSCYARLTTLNDTQFARNYPDAAFQNEKDHTIWEHVLNGPWLSPYAEHTRSYFAALSQEICHADFSGVLLDGISLPSFDADAKKKIGKQASDAKLRREGLTGFINAVTDAEPNAMPVFATYNMFSGKDDAFQPNMLTGNTVNVSINLKGYQEKLTFKGKTYDMKKKTYAERAALLLKCAQETLGKKQMYPQFIRENMTDAEFEGVIQAAVDAGCKTVFVLSYDDE